MQMQSDKIDQLKGAIADWHGKYGCIIGKNKKGAHAEYADLTQILDLIAERGKEFGLVLTQKSMPNNGLNSVYTHLFHKPSGQWDAGMSLLTIIDNPKNPNQEWSSSTTTHRRYDAMSILGLFQADDPSDHDGDKSEENPQGNSSFTQTSTGTKTQFISDKQQGFFRKLGSDNPQKRDMYIKQYGSVDKIPWREFNAIVEDMKVKGPVQKQITEIFGDGELEEVY